MSVQPSLRLNDGREMPQLGLGVWQTPADETAQAVKAAIDAGYRSVDTAAIYRNEKGVGEGLRAASVARADVAVTTKLWNEQQGFDSALKAFDDSLGRLGIDYLDLYLIHWPCPSRDLYVDSWRALIRLKEEGRARSIGVSNFKAEHLKRIIDETGVTPAINQIELHPRWQQQAMRDLNASLGVITESWSPLGQGVLLADPALAAIAGKYGRTPAQVVIRWHLDLGLMVIPKSVTPSRIVENFQVFDFKLDAQDIAAISALDDANGRIGPDPAAFG